MAPQRDSQRADPEREPVLTPEQCRRIDRLAVERYAIPSIVLMENAARGLADAADELAPSAGRCIVFAGPGNNGGDGFAAARHLANRGRAVEIRLITEPAERPADAETNLEIVRRMGIPIVTGPASLAPPADPGPPPTLIDALLGTGLGREVEGSLLDAIDAIIAAADRGARIVAADVPSGLDGDRGVARPRAVRAHVTATFAVLKTGLEVPGAGRWTGSIRVIDIGVPQALVRSIAAEDAPFET